MQQKYLWRFGLALMTALVLVVTGTQGRLQMATSTSLVQAQTVDSGETSPIQSPLAQTTPRSSLPVTSEIPTVTLPTASYSLTTGGYEDPANRFEVGILAGYGVSTINNSPLFESPDGNLAYTVVAKPILPAQSLTQVELAEEAIDTFGNGEGFTPQALQQVSQGGVVIPWTGSLTQGRSSQPISGTILARQTSEQVLLLLISATADQGDQADAVLGTLIDTLKPM